MVRDESYAFHRVTFSQIHLVASKFPWEGIGRSIANGSSDCVNKVSLWQRNFFFCPLLLSYPAWEFYITNFEIIYRLSLDYSVVRNWKKSKWKKNGVDIYDLSNCSIDFKRSMSKVYAATIRWNWWHCQLVRQWRNYRCHR